MENTIALLEAVKSTLNTIPLTGIDAMDKLVGCHNAIATVIQQLKQTQAAAAEPVQEEKEE